jgi:hypothetical protein
LSSIATIACFIQGEIWSDGTTMRACEPRRIERIVCPFAA